MNSCKLSVVVPCFNEQEAVPIFYNEVKKILVTLKVEYEIIFIDDGSSDKTLEEVKELSEKDKGVHYVSFSRNFGKEAAMYAGLKKSSRRLCSDYGCGFTGPSVADSRNAVCCVFR